MKTNSVTQKIASNSPHLSWINDNTVYLSLHGSMSYGTNVPGSDIDYRGICIPPKDYYLGSVKSFEQAELHEPDVTIFELSKFFKLAADCNPSALEILYADSKDIVMVDEIGETILENRDLFLSKKVKHTMTGYAVSQLKRIKLHKAYLMNPPKAPPLRRDFDLPEQTLIPQDQLMAASAEIQKQLDRFNFDFMDHLEDSVKIGIKGIMSDMLAELDITAEKHWMAAARTIGMDDNFIDLMKREREYSAKKREWDQYQNWKTNRNPARALLEEKYGYDCKHALHLVRLMRMCHEILTTGKVIVKRPDREELIAIRNGAWTYEQVLEFAEAQEKIINEIYSSCNILPKTPDKEKLDKLCISLIEKSLRKYSFYRIKKYIDNITG